MAIHYRTQGIFLKKEEKGEADSLFTVYTRDFGKLEILGKAIRKIQSKLRAGAREFCLSEIEFIQGKAFKTLTDAILIEEFKNIKTDLEKLKIIYEVSDVLDSLVRGEEKDENIWNLLIDILKRLNSCQMPAPHRTSEASSGAGPIVLDAKRTPRRVACQLLYYVFLYNLFSLLGYQPQLYNCVLCDKKLEPKNLSWSSEGGGIVCQECFNKEGEKPSFQRINADIIKILRLLLQKDWPTINKLKIPPWYLEQLKAISDNYFLCISGHKNELF